MPDDELRRRFSTLRDRMQPLVDLPGVDAIERRRRRRQARRAGVLVAVVAVVAAALVMALTGDRDWLSDELPQGPVAPGPMPSISTMTTTTTVPPSTTATRPTASVSTPTTASRPTSTTVAPVVGPGQGLRILEPREGTRVRAGQMIRMHGAGCPAGGPVSFEGAGSMRAGPDGSFTTTFEIPPGPSGDFFLDASCGGTRKEVRLIRSTG